MFSNTTPKKGFVLCCMQNLIFWGYCTKDCCDLLLLLVILPPPQLPLLRSFLFHLLQGDGGGSRGEGASLAQDTNIVGLMSRFSCVIDPLAGDKGAVAASWWESVMCTGCVGVLRVVELFWGVTRIAVDNCEITTPSVKEDYRIKFRNNCVNFTDIWKTGWSKLLFTFSVDSDLSVRLGYKQFSLFHTFSILSSWLGDC